MTRTFSLKDVAEHNTKESPWFIIDNKVYDVTKFLEEHPGGPSILLMNAGKDATEEFNSRNHSDNAREWMKKFEIGQLGGQPSKWWKCPLVYAAGAVVIGVAALIIVKAVRSSKH